MLVGGLNCRTGVEQGARDMTVSDSVAHEQVRVVLPVEAGQECNEFAELGMIEHLARRECIVEVLKNSRGSLWPDVMRNATTDEFADTAAMVAQTGLAGENDG